MIDQLTTLVLYCGLGGAIAYLGFRIVSSSYHRFFLIFFLYATTSVTVSQLYLSINPTFVTETGMMSKNSLSSVVYFVCHIAILCGIFFFSRLEKSWPPGALRARPGIAYRPLILLGVTCLLGMIVFIELVNVVISTPNGFTGGAFNRARFFEDIAKLKFLPNVFGVLAFFVPVIAPLILFTSRSRPVRWAAMLIIVGYLLYLRGMGQVFHGMLFPGSMMISIYLFLRAKKLLVFQVPIKSLLAVAAPLLAAVVFQSFMNRGISDYAGGPLQGIIYRILVLQGSASALIFDQFSIGSRVGLDELLDGRAYWINATMPPAAGDAFMEGGTNLQGAVPGTFLLFGGYVGGLALCFVYGIALAAANKAIVYAIQRRSLIALFPASYLWVWAYGVYSRASFEEIVKPKVLIMLAIYFLIVNLPLKKARDVSGFRGSGLTSTKVARQVQNTQFGPS